MNAAISKSIEVSLETVTGLERRMTVRVPAAEIEREVNSRLAKVGKTAKLKGFRPGKVPQNVIRQQYGGQVRDEVLSDVIRSSYTKAIAQQNLNPAGGPKIEPLMDEASEHFSYRAVFEVYPEIELAPLDGMAIERPTVEIADPDVEAMIRKLREQRGEWQQVEREAAKADRVVVDFVGKVDGEAFQGGQGKDVSVVVGSGQVLKDFDKALEGVKAGETKSATVEFPQTYPVENLAGKTADFDITVHRVEERVLPEVDEAFAANFGVTEGGVDALKTEVRTNMERELSERIKAETKTRSFDALIKANSVVVPRVLVEQEIGSLQADSLRQMGTEDPKKALPRERFTQLAERRVTVGLLIQELMKQHKIQLERKRVDQRINELAAPYEKPEEAAQFYRSNRGMMTQVEASVLEDQVVDFLLANAKTTEKPVSFQEFMGA